ncbi:MAG: WD40 repeat domain-containing protein [Anaerolineae bacterium]
MLFSEEADMAKEAAVFEAHGSYVLGLQFTQDGRTLISAGMDNLAHLVVGMAFSPDGKWLALGAADKKIRIWELT